jgi:hypothetical protein
MTYGTRRFKGFTIIPIISRINQITRIDIYFFKIYSNIVLPSTIGLRKGLFHVGLTNQLHGLWKPEVQCCINKGFPIIPILGRINPTPRIDTYFFKIYSNIVLPSTIGLRKGLFPVGLPN